jgi:hypothetical protein
MATEFLLNFSKQAHIDTVMKDFTPTCQGTDDERGDVERNRSEYTITAYHVEPAQVTVGFGGVCQFAKGPREGDACSVSAVEWDSKKANGEKEKAVGVDQISAKYLNDRWWLCSSDFLGRTTSGLRFIL